MEREFYTFQDADSDSQTLSLCIPGSSLLPSFMSGVHPTEAQTTPVWYTAAVRRRVLTSSLAFAKFVLQNTFLGMVSAQGWDGKEHLLC